MSYPINLDIDGKICIVLGGGHVAFRKVKGLLNAGGKVILISPEICEDIKKLVEDDQIEWKCQSYSSNCLPKGLILIAATDNPKINQLAAIEASNKNMLINIVNSSLNNLKRFNVDSNNNSAFRIPHSALFTVPSVIHKNNLTLTISTEGLSPALSKSIRQHLETQFNDNFAQWLERLSKIRDEVKNIIKDANTREEFWRNVMSNENFSLAQNGELDKAEVNIRNVLKSYRCKSQDCTD